MIQFFTLCVLAARSSGEPFSAEYMARLHAMYQFMDEIVADTGLLPNMGDSDDGYVLAAPIVVVDRYVIELDLVAGLERIVVRKLHQQFSTGKLGPHGLTPIR